jgi:hypothetical protein
MGSARIAVVVLAVIVVGACIGSNNPRVVIPPGVTSTRTADEVRRFMLAEIAANERTLGRALAPARVIRIQLLRSGEIYETRHFDGTNPDGAGMSPSDGPGWMVEAIGTFVSTDDSTGAVVARGTHGFHLYDDAGGESWAFIPCWTLSPLPPEQKEGRC